MMKNLIFLILLFLCVHLLQAQSKGDSLLAVLSQASKDEKANILNQLSLHYQESDSVRSMKYARQALTLGEKTNNRQETCDAWFNMGECLYCFEEFDAAWICYRKALDIAERLNDNNRIARTLNSIALTHYFRSEYDLAIENQMKALRCLKDSNESDILARVYSNMGMVYSRVGDFRRSIGYYREAAAVNKKSGSIYDEAINYNGIGVAYYNMDLLDSSAINYTIALKGFRSVNDREKIAITLNNIANVFVSRGDSLEKALVYFRQALDVFEELNDTRNSTFVLESLGSAYLKLGDHKKALEILLPGLELAKKHRIGYYIQQVYYRDISRTYEEMGKTTEAYAAYKLHRSYLDSLRQEERIRQMDELEKKFETEKKEEEILRLNAEKEVVDLQIQKEKTIRTFITVLLFLSVGIAIAISYAYFDKKRTNQVLKQKNEQIEHQRNELEKVNATKNKFFSILAHDLKNPFHTIMGYSSLLHQDYGRFTEEERRKYAGDIYKSANAIFRLLQNLLDWSRSQTGNMKYNPVKFDLRRLSESVFCLMKPLADQKNISLNNLIPEGVFLYADPMMVETILRNLMSNAVKFSYDEGQVSVQTTREETGQVTLSICDEGEGLSKDDLEHLFRIDSRIRRKGTRGEEGSGLGLTLCKEFVQINKGTIQVKSEPGKGSVFCITLPAEES